ncbi:hypothetical protein GLOIN_2v1476024 [Rhizophagus irregularis DAOM 181602=DAOM 197198]|uniref:Uncharacterized protein n=3 Tax=Rhizophagus irregularis TaxID=588596 RepID=A0A2P4QAJ8_RHIID|nr:hypothetical protein GLOIN_2v1476024 [Rhizophagus irregularis DAOM 181602=DAOM 197198]POG74673.1 hypothetical protein GLOIN_2v1476024 [Rhizophagus irregularis DAOM 181602=DAOM 197198]|eukprot:XP_025181539.1 hypothetical protein GLOIN_2v1476024 [Rhizophagus irregularis DAOM 181602=DAOM 197198]
MPAKLSTVCYVHESREHLTQDFTIKDITAVSRLDDQDPTKVLYLRIKAFIPSDNTFETQIEDFETGDIIFLKGKKHRDKEPREFWVEVFHDPNLRYLENKTNSINQTMRSTTVMLVGVIFYVPPVIDEVSQEETIPGKHALKLEDISLISNNRNNNSNQTLNVPWLNSQSSSRSSRTPRGATPRSPRRGRVTLAQMNPTRNQSLASALQANPIPSMNLNTDETTEMDPPQENQEE